MDCHYSYTFCCSTLQLNTLWEVPYMVNSLKYIVVQLCCIKPGVILISFLFTVSCSESMQLIPVHVIMLEEMEIACSEPLRYLHYTIIIVFKWITTAWKQSEFQRKQFKTYDVILIAYKLIYTHPHHHPIIILFTFMHVHMDRVYNYCACEYYPVNSYGWHVQCVRQQGWRCVPLTLSSYTSYQVTESLTCVRIEVCSTNVHFWPLCSSYTRAKNAFCLWSYTKIRCQLSLPWLLSFDSFGSLLPPMLVQHRRK